MFVEIPPHIAVSDFVRRVSRTAFLLNSSVKRLCLLPLIATSSIFHRGWLSTLGMALHFCRASPQGRFRLFTSHWRAIEVCPRRPCIASASVRGMRGAVEMICNAQPNSERLLRHGASQAASPSGREWSILLRRSALPCLICAILGDCNIPTSVQGTGCKTLAGSASTD
jgi:hypothetical protein